MIFYRVSKNSGRGKKMKVDQLTDSPISRGKFKESASCEVRNVLDQINIEKKNPRYSFLPAT